MRLRCDDCGHEIKTPFGACPHCGYSGLGGGATPPPDPVLVILYWTDFCIECGRESGVKMRADGLCWCAYCWQAHNG
jgi:hypothetical protein